MSTGEGPKAQQLELYDQGFKLGAQWSIAQYYQSSPSFNREQFHRFYQVRKPFPRS